MTAQFTTYQKQIQALLTEKSFHEAVDVWMKAADEISGQPEALLLLAREFLEAGAKAEAAELVSLVAPSLKEKGKWPEWLWALKLLARLQPRAPELRQQLLEALEMTYGDDARVPTILSVSGLLDPSRPLVDAIDVADALLSLKGGSYCHHKSWGYGRVSAFDVTLGIVRVDFNHRAGHPLQLEYAAESLTPLPADHIVARKAENLDTLKSLAADDPLALIKITLHSFGRRATAEQIEGMLCPDVVPPDQWKRWWDAAKRMMKKDTHIALPPKKAEPIVLREVPVSVQEELLQSFENARGLKPRMAVALELLKQVDEFEDPELLVQGFFAGLIEAMRAATAAERSHLLEAALVCEELRQHQRAPVVPDYPEALTQLAARTDSLIEQLESVSAQRHAQAVEFARALCGDGWADAFLRALPRLSSRLLEKAAQHLAAHGEAARLRDLTQRAIYDQSASVDWLLCLCRIRNEPAWRECLGALWTPRFLLAILAALETEKARFAASRHASRLLEFIMEDKELIADLLAEAEVGEVRDAARRLLATNALDELTKRSLIARVIKVHPEIQELLTGAEPVATDTALIVSWPSLERRRAELEDIINRKIPENSRAIAQARSYGDLSENFEFKAAKEAQRLLQRRRAELERDLAQARATYFEDAPATHVGIGCRVTVTDTGSGAERDVYILGAWDGDPQRGIISYLTPMAQSLLGKKVGELAEMELENHRSRLRVDAISRIPREFLEQL